MEQPPNQTTNKDVFPENTGIIQVDRLPNGQFPPGKSGNPKGKPKGSLAFKTALEKWAYKNAGKLKLEDGTEEVVTAIELITHKLMDMAMKGDIQAIKEVSDRMDGKAKQSIDHTTTGLPIIEISAEIAQKYNLNKENDTTSGTEEDRGQS